MRLSRDKIRLIRDFTKVGLDVLISDIDVAWLEDPIPYFQRHPRADMLVSTGENPPADAVSPLLPSNDSTPV